MYTTIALLLFLCILGVAHIKKDWLPNFLGYPLNKVVVKYGAAKNELFGLAWIRLLKTGSTDSDDVWVLLISYIVFVLAAITASLLWAVLLPLLMVRQGIRALLINKNNKNKNNNKTTI